LSSKIRKTLRGNSRKHNGSYCCALGKSCEATLENTTVHIVAPWEKLRGNFRNTTVHIVAPWEKLRGNFRNTTVHIVAPWEKLRGSVGNFGKLDLNG